MFMHNSCSYCYIDVSNIVYVLVHRNILMYIIYTCIPFVFVDLHLKAILAVCLVFSIL